MKLRIKLCARYRLFKMRSNNKCFLVHYQCLVNGRLVSFRDAHCVRGTLDINAMERGCEKKLKKIYSARTVKTLVIGLSEITYAEYIKNRNI